MLPKNGLAGEPDPIGIIIIIIINHHHQYHKKKYSSSKKNQNSSIIINHHHHNQHSSSSIITINHHHQSSSSIIIIIIIIIQFWSGFIPVNGIGWIYPTLTAISPTSHFPSCLIQGILLLQTNAQDYSPSPRASSTFSLVILTSCCPSLQTPTLGHPATEIKINIKLKKILMFCLIPTEQLEISTMDVKEVGRSLKLPTLKLALEWEPSLQTWLFHVPHCCCVSVWIAHFIQKREGVGIMKIKAAV